MVRASVLIADDETTVRWSLRERLARDGYEILEACTAHEALERIRSVDLVLLDCCLPDSDGVAVLQRINDLDSDVPVIVLAKGREGAAGDSQGPCVYHRVHTPFNTDEIAVLVEKALETSRLRREVRAFRETQAQAHGLDAIVGDSAPMQCMKDLLARIASSTASTVLLRGEPGVGKHLAARVIHYTSARAPRPFASIKGSGLPEELLASELFGHEPGAVTGARAQTRGLFELTDGGSVFLDHIDAISPTLQVRLLRFLEERTFSRSGSTGAIRADVRLIAAGGPELERLVRDRKFREDLYYRLQAMPITIPPLRERRGDVAALVTHYVGVFNREFRKTVRGASAEAIVMLEAHHWPGNVRELRNAVERAMLLADGDVLQAEDFGASIPGAAAAPPFQLPADGVNLEQLERKLLIEALQRAGGNQTHAGLLLGINRDQVRYRIEKFGLQLPTHEKTRHA